MFGFDDYDFEWYNEQYDFFNEKFLEAYYRSDEDAIKYYDNLLLFMEESPREWLDLNPVPGDYYVH